MKKFFAAAVLSFVMAFASSAFAAPIVMDGSTTVLPFGQAAAEQFMKSNPGVKFSVSGTGTGNGFKSILSAQKVSIREILIFAAVFVSNVLRHINNRTRINIRREHLKIHISDIRTITRV